LNRIAIADAETGFNCSSSETLLRSGLRAGLGMPYECSIGTCGECKFEALVGEFAPHAGPPLVGLSARDVARGRMLACQAKPLSDCTIRLYLEDRFKPQIAPAYHHATLIAVEAIAPEMMFCRFQSDEPAKFRPGQYARLLLGEQQAWRAFSMCDLPNDEGYWDFLIRPVAGGIASEALFAAGAVGQSYVIDAPYGNAWHRSGTRQIFCIAGGAGLAPTLSVARAAAADPACETIHFFYGGRTPADLCAEALLGPAARPDLAINFHNVVSGEAPGWSGAYGMLHDYLDATFGDIPGAADCYVAGPPPMVEAVIEVLRMRKDVPVERIYFDRFFG
jgi:toluene monooxygenase electron transfer component